MVGLYLQFKPRGHLDQEQAGTSEVELCQPSTSAADTAEMELCQPSTSAAVTEPSLRYALNKWSLLVSLIDHLWQQGPSLLWQDLTCFEHFS